MGQKKYYIYFILGTLFWGGSFLAIQFSVQGFGSLFAAFLRILVGLGFTAIICLIRKRRFLVKGWHKPFFVGFFSTAIPWIFLFWAEQYIAPAVASIINSMVPIFTIILSPFFSTKEVISSKKIYGVLLGFFGVVIVFYPQIHLENNHNELLAFCALLIMALSYGLGTVFNRKIGHEFKTQVNLFYQYLGAIFLVMVVMLFADQPLFLPAFDYKAVLAIFYLGIFSTGIAYLFYVSIVKHVGSVQAASMVLFVPVIAIFLDFLVLGRILELNEAIGAVVVLSSLFLILKR